MMSAAGRRRISDGCSAPQQLNTVVVIKCRRHSMCLLLHQHAALMKMNIMFDSMFSVVRELTRPAVQHKRSW